jgi:ABC-type nitrate/sulfonate/bicarbonate transport system ATPase subunit
MPLLSTELFDRVVKLLLPFMLTVDQRQTELSAVVLGKSYYAKIQWDGDPETFTKRLVPMLPLDDLSLVLKRLTVGEEKLAEIEAARMQLDLLSKIESSAIAHVRALLNQDNIREALVRLNDVAREFSPQHHAEAIALTAKAAKALTAEAANHQNVERPSLIQELATRILHQIATDKVENTASADDSEQLESEWRKQYVRLQTNSQPSAQAVLSCTKLSRAYPTHNFALQDVSFNLFRGEVMAVIGANASGKTTLLDLIAGARFADTGELIYPCIGNNRLNWNIIRNDVIHVDEQKHTWRGTPRENLHFASAAKYDSIDERLRIVDDYVFKFDLAQYMDTDWTRLTGGIRARLSLVRALLLKPKLLILDEPIAHTDPFWTNLYLEELYRLSKITTNLFAVIFST